MKKILYILIILVICAGTSFWQCLGFLFFIDMIDGTDNKNNKEYDPQVHRDYINGQKL